MSLIARKFILRVRGALASLLIVAVVVMFFQNCSDPVLTDPALASASSEGFDSSFAYKTNASHFAYMSCPYVPPDNRASHFTFRVGAYNNGFGLGLNSDFLGEIDGLNSTLKRSRLQGSAQNQNVNLEWSIRNRYDLRETTTVGGRNPIVKRDHDIIFPKLDSDDVASTLIANFSVSNPEPLRTIAGNATSTGARHEGSMRFFEGEVSASALRNQLSQNGSSYLTLGFVEDVGSGTYQPRSPAGNDRMHGVGFAPSFSPGFFLPGTTPQFVSSASTGIKVVTGLTEVDLKTGQANNTAWSCPSTTRFMVVRYVDVAAGAAPGTFACGIKEDYEYSYTTAQLADLARIRQVLPQHLWYVDLNKRCIVDKSERFGASGNVCYGVEANTAWINYTGNVGPDVGNSGVRTAGGSGNCTSVENAGGTNGVTVTLGGATRHVLCPHFVSVCYRQTPN
jgi:hypothetical protein